ncbi:MFS transporter [Burkholderia multivorans]|uniref:MFS transporter n=1 Tax=Burkholderia multivorans TaxID=87883 RepID=UPI0021BF43A4|nr:MFS transporter [Burkholderia multivorans]
MLAPSTDEGIERSSPHAASWSAVVAVGVGAFAIVTTEFLPVGLLPQIAADLHVAEGEAGLMVTLPGIMAALSAPVTIALARGVDRRRLLWLLMALVAVSNVVAATATGFISLLFGRFLLGSALGGFWTIGGSLGPRLRSGSQASKATAVILSGISLGTIAGLPLGAFLAVHLGWRAAFASTAVISAMVVIALIALLPSIPRQASSGLKAVPELLARRSTRLALAVTLLTFGGQFAAYTYIAPFLRQSSHITPSGLSAVLFGYGLAGFFGNVAGGWTSERHSRAAVVTTAIVLATAISALIATGDSAVTAAVCVALWGFGFGMAPVTIQKLTLDSAPDHLEAAAALLVCVLQIAIGLGSLAGGALADRSGPVGAFWLGVAALLGAGVLVGGALVRERSEFAR